MAKWPVLAEGSLGDVPRFDSSRVAGDREPARVVPETPAAGSGRSAEDRFVAVHGSGMIARIFRGRLARQLAAVAAVVLATLLRMAFERRGLALPTYITFYPAVILAALMGGMWAGILATALSALSVDYFFLPPIGQFAIGSTSDSVAMAIFCISGASISLVTELYHRRGQKLAALQIEAAVVDERRKTVEAQARAESIRAERQRFLDVLETLPPMISLLTPDRHIAFANRSFRDRFGECRGQRCFEARFGRAEPCDFCETYSVFETGQPHHWEVIFPDGSLVDAHDFPFTDLDGSSLILEMGVDITERRRSETELQEHRERLEAMVEERTRQLQAANAQLETDVREREQAERVLETTVRRFHTILSNLSAGVLLVTNEGRIEFANQAICDLFKLAESPAELMAAFDSEMVIAKVCTAYENHEQAVLRIREILARGQPVLSEEVPMQDGSTYLRDFVPLIVDGKSYGRMWVHTDITELKRKEGALRESRAKLAAALASMTDSVIITDAEGRFVEFNDAFARFYRFKSKAECARSFDEFASIFEVFLANGERAPREMYAIQRALRGEAATGAEYTLRRKDTGESWIGSISFSPVRGSDGAIIGTVITARDITEAKRAETRLRRFYETDLFAILYWTIDGGVLDVNDKFLAMTGYSREDLRAGLLNWSQITPPEYWPLDEDARRQIRETGIHLPYEKEFVRKDGARVWGLFSAAAYEDDRSQGVSFILDITKRKRAEEALREERATLRGILDATDESVWLIGADCTILSANATALKRVGRQAEEIFGKTIGEITEPKVAERRSACIRQVVETKQPLEVEDERDGMMFRHHYYPVLDSSGRIDRVVVYSRDITQSKRAEETLHRYRLLAAHTRDIVLFIRFDDGLILEANAAAAEAYGHTIERLKCMKIHDLREPSTRPLTDIEMSKAEMQGILFESIHQRADGSVFPVEVSSQGAKIGGICTLISIIRDITERKRAEEYSKNSFVALSNFVPQFVWMCTPDGLNTYFNQRWVDYTGLTLEESYGRGWNTPFHPDDKQPSWDAWNKAVETGGEYSIESRLRAADGSYRRFLIRGEPMRDTSGSILRWFGTCTDIEDMKRESEGRFRSVVGSMSEGLMFFDPNGNVIYQNPASLRIHALEAKPDEPLEAGLLKATWKAWDDQGRPLSPDEWPASRVLREGSLENQILRVQRIETGHEFDASYNGCLLHDSAGNVTGGFITIHDITKRKRFEEALRSSRQQLQAIIDGAPDTVVFLKDIDGRFITVNSRFEELLGIARDDVRGKTDYDILTSEQAETFRAHDQLVLRTGLPMQIEETALLADGKEHTFLASKFPLFDAGGKPYAVCAISADITERKRMEEALQESEERYRNLFNAMTEGFCIVEVLLDAEGKPADYRFLEVNDAFERQTGLHDAVGKRMRELAPAHEEHWFEIYGKVALTGEPVRFINEASALNRWYDVHAYRVGEPEQRRVAIVFDDFSEFKRAEEALQRSEAQFRSLANAIPQLSWMANADGWLFWYNERWYEYTGTTPEQMEGWGWQSVHDPEVLPQVLERWKASIATSAPFDMVFPLRGADGVFRPFLTRVMPVKDAEGKVARWFGTNTNIGDQKRAEEQLKKLNRTLKALSNSNQAILHATDEPSFLKEVCRVITRVCGHAMVWIGVAENDEHKTVRPVAFSGFEQGYLETLSVKWDESERGRGPTGTAIRTGQPSMCRNMLTDPAFAPWREDAVKRGYASSLVIPLKEQEKAWGAITIYSREPDAFTEGEVELLTELAGDLEFGIQTLRLRAAHARAEEALRESEELLGLFVEHAPAALAMFDGQMRYLHASRRWRADYGLGDRDLGGLSHYEVFPEIPEQWKEAHCRGLAGEVLSGDADRFERADGSVQWIRWEIRPWRDAEGRVGGIVIFTEEVTERKKAQEALLRAEKAAFQRQQLQALAERLQRVREEERKMVARDLHDQIGQILTAIKMDMTWAVRHLPRANDEVHERLKGSIELINDGVRSVRRICSGLRPGILDDLGLAAAVEWQSNEFAARAGIRCEVSVPAGELRLDGDRATAIFRIYQECLTNVARHAEARTVRTSLYRQDENLVLAVHDDGKGFNESEIAGSLGVLGMKERAQVCGGSVQVSSSPGEGTTITVCVPLQASGAEQGQLAHTDSR